MDKKNREILKMNKDISKKLKWTKEKLKGEKKNTIRLKIGLETAMKETRVPIVDAIVLKAIYKRVICITKQQNSGNKNNCFWKKYRTGRTSSSNLAVRIKHKWLSW